MDVAANDAIGPAAARLGDHGVLEIADIFDRVLYPVLQVGRQRPVAKAERPPGDVEPGVQRQRQGVGIIADEGQPLGVFNDAVELVAVQHQEAPPVGSHVDGVSQHHDPAEAAADEGSETLVVVSRNIDDLGALARLAQKLLDDVVMFLTPRPVPLQPPSIDDVANQVQVVGLRMLQEVQQKIDITSTSPKMNVRDKDRTITSFICGKSVHRSSTNHL